MQHAPVFKYKLSELFIAYHYFCAVIGGDTYIYRVFRAKMLLEGLIRQDSLKLHFSLTFHITTLELHSQ